MCNTRQLKKVVSELEIKCVDAAAGLEAVEAYIEAFLKEKAFAKHRASLTPLLASLLKALTSGCSVDLSGQPKLSKSDSISRAGVAIAELTDDIYSKLESRLRIYDCSTLFQKVDGARRVIKVFETLAAFYNLMPSEGEAISWAAVKGALGDPYAKLCDAKQSLDMFINLHSEEALQAIGGSSSLAKKVIDFAALGASITVFLQKLGDEINNVIKITANEAVRSVDGLIPETPTLESAQLLTVPALQKVVVDVPKKVCIDMVSSMIQLKVELQGLTRISVQPEVVKESQCFCHSWFS